MEKKKLTWISVQAKLKHLSERDLKGIIKELYLFNKEVKDFLHTKFYNDTDIIDAYKNKIEKFLMPHPTRWRYPKIAKAKKLIQDYKKATNDNKGILKLKLHYYFLLTKFRNKYGPDIYVDSPADIAFTSILDLLKIQEKDLILYYLPQIIILRKKWDVEENIESTLYQISPLLSKYYDQHYK